MSSDASPARNVEECKHQFNDIRRNDKTICSFCKNVAAVSCVNCNCNACMGCTSRVSHIGLTEKRGHSATPPRDDGDAHKERRVGPGFGDDEPASQPATEPSLSKEEARVIVREFKEQCEELTRDHFAALKKLSDSVRSKLAIGGACLGDGEKKELLKGALTQGEEVVSLLKALQGNSFAALAPSPKRIVGVALRDGVSLFVGGVPREAEEDALLKILPPGAQIVNSFRGGKGKFGFLEVSVHSEDADKMVDQKVSYFQRELRVAKWNKDAPKSNVGRGVHDAQHDGRFKNKEHAAPADGLIFGSPQEMGARKKNSSLVLKNLKYDVDEKLLSKLFPSATFTKVLSRDGRPQGLGFADFTSEAAATEAMDSMNGKDISGRRVVIAYSLRQSSQDGDRHLRQGGRLAGGTSGPA